ncbi:MAG TPA: translation initiation factor IF-6 [Thermoplasmata archaeon]|nr:translation initiation factor IF-6 [Thermoplasmata archaeon]
MLVRLDVNGNPNIGSLAVANNEVAIVAPVFSETTARELARALEVEIIRTTLGGMTVLGSLCVLTDGRALVSNIVDDTEIEVLRQRLDVEVLDDRLNAVGNNILVGRRAALVNPRYSRRAMRIIADLLDVEVVPGTIGGLKIVGSAAAVNSKGVLCHPKVDASETALLEEVFGVPVMLGTANFGSPMLGSAMVVNDTGAATGSLTTGVELNRIETSLGLI